MTVGAVGLLVRLLLERVRYVGRVNAFLRGRVDPDGRLFVVASHDVRHLGSWD
jgi:hypothetical protein